MKITAQIPQASSAKNHVIEGSPGMTPIFRWAGSKKKLIKELNLVAPSGFNRYFEPFFGSGVFYLNQHKRGALLSDFNEDLIQAYQVIRDEPEDLWRACMSIPETPEAYYEIRGIAPESLKDVERAARFVYLNRYCFNGVYRTNLSGKFNVSRGKGNLGIPSWAIFDSFSKKLQGSVLECCDFEASTDKSKLNDFVYLDPPYIDLEKRNRGEYGVNSFSFDDLSRLAAAARRAHNRGAKVLISYSECSYMRDLFKDWTILPLNVSRSISCKIKKRDNAKEIFIASYI